MVVGRRAAVRWSLAASLQLEPAAASPPDLALSRMTHPVSRAPDVVVLVVEDPTDLAWLRGHTRRRVDVPVVAALARPSLANAARAAGAAQVVALDASTAAHRRAVRRATAPGVVIDLDAVRTA